MKSKHEGWREHLSNWRASGKTEAHYCREAKISLSSFQYYKSLLEKEVSSPRFVEIGHEESIELVLSEKVSLRFPAGTPMARIAELVQCLS